jgi:glycosyltransferase involved in cell wall biosynthesis
MQPSGSGGPVKFSVIVPFLNERPYIADCIAGLLGQDFAEAERELIFVDNGSTDGSAAVVAAYPQIQLVAESRRDPYLARNRGIAQAQGEYLLFLDADCQPEPDWLAEMSAAVEGRPADILLGNILFPRPTPWALRYQQDYYNSKMGYLLSHELRVCYYGHAGNMGIRRGVFDEVGVFRGMPEVGDTAVIHDLMALRPDARILHVPKAEVVHLEVRNFRQYLNKLGNCGGYTGYYESTHGFRPLTLGEKLAVMQHCAREHGYSLPERLALLVSLFIGWRAFERGKARPPARSAPAG